MQRMMSAMTPEMMSQAQAMAGKMSPEDWASARNSMAGMTPQQLEQQTSQAQQQFGQQQAYILRVSGRRLWCCVAAGTGIRTRALAAACRQASR
jgi:hypothetical protein